MDPDSTKIAIMGENVPARNEIESIDKLLFFPENPRVYSVIREMEDFNTLTDEEKQRRIYERLLEESSVKNLLSEVKRDGGLHEPIIVRYDNMQVIEGNSRLAVYRKLNCIDRDSERWSHIRCLVVTSLTDDQQTRLLGQSHLHGKTDWTPYAKALFCYRWVVEERRTIKDLANLSGLSVRAIGSDLKKIRLMRENADQTASNFSYYHVLVSNRRISARIAEDDGLRRKLLSEIKSVGESKGVPGFTAQNMRDQLPNVLNKPKVLRKYMNGTLSLEEAHEIAKPSNVEQVLRGVRDKLDAVEIGKLENLEPHELRSLEQVARQIGQKHKRVSGMIAAQLTGEGCGR